MNRLEFSCFESFFVGIFKTKEEYFFFNPPVEGNVNSMEQKGLKSSVKMMFKNSTADLFYFLFKIFLIWDNFVHVK
jgi:hypothetical protein